MLSIICYLAIISYTWAAYPTSKIGPGNSEFKQLIEFDREKLVAFVDVNNDRRTDIIVVNSNGGIDALLEPDSRNSPIIFFDTSSPNLPSRIQLLPDSLFTEKPIQAISVSDFNGDSFADLLILVKDSKPGYKVLISFGFIKENNFSLATPESFTQHLSKQPIVGDFNADGIADIYGEISGGTRGIYFGSTAKTDLSFTIASTSKSWSELGYSAFADFKALSIPQFFIFTERNTFDYYQNALVLNQKQLPSEATVQEIALPLEYNYKVIGQFKFADFNRDGFLDFIVPFCQEDNCQKDSSSLLMYEIQYQRWTKLKLNLTPVGFTGTGSWSFTLYDNSLGLLGSSLAGITQGDINLDSWMDLTAILTYNNNGITYTVPAILMNYMNNSFQAYILPGVSLDDNEFVVQMAFFDQNEDGVLDIWLTTTKNKNTFSTRLILQQQSNNNYFLMAMTLSGLCDNNPKCMAYGVPIPGSYATFTTHAFTGEIFGSIGVVAPLTTCNALELPYILFGLGEMANYIEEVKLGIISNSPSLQPKLQIVMDFIVPDSQLVMNPNPRSDPSNYKVTLFLQPLRNMKVLLIAITLITLMLFLAILIMILQCLEVRADREEKLQETQGFHF